MLVYGLEICETTVAIQHSFYDMQSIIVTYLLTINPNCFIFYFCNFNFYFFYFWRAYYSAADAVGFTFAENNLKDSLHHHTPNCLLTKKSET
jgi:hypothetical protein